ncbi:3-keto-disaccharide hydrolase [Neolewinella antarctica]|uniref:3-keto-alpha-glucoside-1,2-lyase/3-keto-2-hydroxy-glucal hydratase domain-containing protein n=1 Tax=Neolewinella antarctica TaxID=442734 RepID=A0ABX0XB30_9BACT|nr:DUF1080 domain-containing protein [Neolewinella antarctica]NJC26471.1 hypothetical protein [Neolewinella antarctica]
MKFIYLSLCVLLAFGLDAQITDPKATEFYTPVPPKVESGESIGTPPSDAIVLLGLEGDLSAWVAKKDSSPVAWTVADGVMTVKAGTGDIKTRRTFGDVQLHLEWRSPNEPDKEGQNRGNSGVFLMDRYEVQILESNGGETYTNGQAGSIYKESPPLVNVTSKMGDWNTYNIVFMKPHFNADGMLIRPATITVLHNGVLIQNHWEIKGVTEYIGLHKYTAHGDDVISLQDHSNEVSYRNIWVREL